jgi:hypothetical protein
MADAGLDLYYSLPLLSTYLGHSNLQATEGNIRLTEEMYPGIIADSNKDFSVHFPGRCPMNKMAPTIFLSISMISEQISP